MLSVQEMANRYPLHQPQMQSQNLGNGITPGFPRLQAGIWPQLPPHQQLADEQSEKQREYLKQQQKLRLMTTTSTPQTVSADTLIENLLGKKETFKPKNSQHGLVLGTAPGSQHVLGNVGVPVQGLGLAPSYLDSSVKPAVIYPGPSTTSVSPGPSSAMSMMGGYVMSVSPESFAHVPLSSTNKGYAAVSQMNTQLDVNVPSQAQFSFSLPTWVTPSSQLLPQLYRQVWKLVEQDNGLVDTTRIFPLLLTSGLPTDVLGFIWGLANHKVAGQLTEQELYIVLALVALAQNGCTFNNLGVLNLIPQPPVPSLNVADFQSVASTPSKNTEVAVTLNPGKMKREELNLHLSRSSTLSIPTLSPAGDDAGFDEFTDFQSAVLPVTQTTAAAVTTTTATAVMTTITTTTTASIKEQVLISKPPENQSNTVAILGSEVGTAQKCPSVMVIGSIGHGRGIGSRLANHSLGTPKQKKTKHHHHHHHRSHPQVAASLDEDFSEFQQAKNPGSSGDGTADGIFSKCMTKTLQGKTYLLKESAIRAEMKLESSQQTAGTVEDGRLTSFEGITSNFEPTIERKSTSLSSEKSKSDGDKEDQNVALGVHNMESGPRSNISVSGLQESKREGVNLMSIEEDKYSALRVLSLIGQDTSHDKTELCVSPEQSPASDDFGDFLSAEPAQLVEDSFADIAAREKVLSKNVSDLSAVGLWKAVETPQTAEFQVDDWGEYKDALTCNTSSYLDQTFDMTGENKNKLGDTTSKIKTETDISAAFMDLYLGNESSDVWDLKDSIGMAGDEKEKTSDFLSLAEPSLDLNTDSSWDFKLKDDGDSHDDTALNGSERAGESSNFQGFLGKIYDDSAKNEQYSLKADTLCPSPDDQLHGGRSDNSDIDIQTHGSNDDFGEFVGPNTWPDEQKYSVMTKDSLFDGHLGQGLYSDSQSVSSLELPPLTLSRHGSVPSLDLKIFPSTADKSDGSGGSHHWDMSPQGIDHQLSEWQRCLQSCLTLLQSAVEIFNGTSCGDVLDEVIGSTEGKAYLQNLLEVAGVSHRVECSYKQLGNSGEYKQLDSLLADIHSTWSSLESYYVKADISVHLEMDLPVGSGNGSSSVCDPTVCCGVCLTDVNSGARTDSSRNTSQLEYGGHIYHSVCANLWVNCVDSSLPALATGSSSFL
ncbi:synergin gamma isoform X2 [Cryptotermes secundus]|uniref:synergin gamma isoform X2 n=1 Tax=Cryptotermes secundus TaxID=105785 RepID=UPI000CD7C07C|nr:synergin gamma isoform X2 [Cryptotermes secundus]